MVTNAGADGALGDQAWRESSLGAPSNSMDQVPWLARPGRAGGRALRRLGGRLSLVR
jgi:hypothetical protein